MTLQLKYQMHGWWMHVKACQSCSTYFNCQSIQTKYIPFGCSPSQPQSSPGILECLVIVDPLLNHDFPLLEGSGSIPIHTKHASQRLAALKLHELFLQVRNGVRRRKRRWDPAFWGCGNVGGTWWFESCSVILAEIWACRTKQGTRTGIVRKLHHLW